MPSLKRSAFRLAFRIDSTRYCDMCLAFVKRQRLTFSHDRSRVHTSGKTTLEAGVEPLLMPSRSCDLNSIEKVWSLLKGNVAKRPESLRMRCLTNGGRFRKQRLTPLCRGSRRHATGASSARERCQARLRGQRDRAECVCACTIFFFSLLLVSGFNGVRCKAWGDFWRAKMELWMGKGGWNVLFWGVFRVLAAGCGISDGRW